MAALKLLRSAARFSIAASLRRSLYTISAGQNLPDSTFAYFDAAGELQTVSISDLTMGKRSVLFAKWHPDKWGRKPWFVEEANRKFQEIQEACQVLSDQRKRALYDSGFYDPIRDEQEEEVEVHS